MTGLDGKSAHLQMVRAQLCVKCKKIHVRTRESAKELVELAREMVAAKYAQLSAPSRMAFATLAA